MIGVSEKALHKSGHSASAVQYPPEAEVGYLGVVTGTHRIHWPHAVWVDRCLSFSSEKQRTREIMPEMYERHIEHCIDYIRRGIICNFDPEIVIYHCVRDHQFPTSNGNAWHKCVDWDAVTDRLKDKAVQWL